MSYNREWDRGKDSWDDYDNWNDYSGHRGNVRGRDDEYYNEGKRRKYNHGVRVSSIVQDLIQNLMSYSFSANV